MKPLSPASLDLFEDAMLGEPTPEELARSMDRFRRVRLVAIGCLAGAVSVVLVAARIGS